MVKVPILSNTTNTIYNQVIFNQSYLREKSTINNGHHGNKTVGCGEPSKTKHKNFGLILKKAKVSKTKKSGQHQNRFVASKVNVF